MKKIALVFACLLTGGVAWAQSHWVGGELGYKYIWEDGPTVMRVKDPVIPTDTIPIPYK